MVFVASVGLPLKVDFGTVKVKLEQDSLVVTASF